MNRERKQNDYDSLVKNYQKWKKNNSSDKRVTTSNTPIKLHLSSHRSSVNDVLTSARKNDSETYNDNNQQKMTHEVESRQSEADIYYQHENIADDDCNILEIDEMKPKKPTQKLEMENASEFNRESIIRKYMTPEPQSDILHQSNFRADIDLFNDDIGIYTKTKFHAPKQSKRKVGNK